MKLHFRLQQLLQQAPGGVKWNMSATEKHTYNMAETQKDDMMGELFTLMQNDGDI